MVPAVEDVARVSIGDPDRAVGRLTVASLLFAEGMDPGWRGREVYALMKYRRRDDWDDRPKGRKPGDKYVIIGAAVGMAAGGVGGFMVNATLGFLGIVGGGVMGALLGSLVGFLKTRKTKSNMAKNVKEDASQNEDPL